MTSQAAEAFGFADHGLVAEGLRANLWCSTPRVSPTARRSRIPLQFPVGVRDVFVGGEAVVRHGEMTGRRAGTVVS
jgi:N-acyl-D-aspartate/D-glutamate deacylase